MTTRKNIVVYCIGKWFSLLFLCLTIPVTVYSSVDSLKQELQFATTDSQRIIILQKLTQELNSNNSGELFQYGNQYLELASLLDDETLQVEALSIMADNYYRIGNYDETLENLFKAVVIVEKLGDGMRLARLYNDIGIIYNEIGQNQNAISYFDQSLQLKNKLDDSTTISYTLNNIGQAYMRIDQLELAKDHFLTALSIDERLMDSVGIYSSLSNLGGYFLEKEQFDSSLTYFERALPIIDEVGTPYDMASFLNSWGNVYFEQGDFEKAIEYYEGGLKIGLENFTKATIKESYRGISNCYSALEDFQSAYEYYRQYQEVEDSIFSETNIKKMMDVQANYELIQKQNEIELLRQERKINNLKYSNTRVWMISLIGGLSMIFIFMVILFQKNRSRNKTNQLLQKKNQEILSKTQSMVDSINYAKRIQDAIQPKHNQLFKFFEEAFVYSKARDIVNGDFYWFSNKGDYFILAAVDCTGHGVPGAFMNVMGNSLLNQVVNAENITSPSEILAELNKRVVFNLHQNEISTNSNDGMDIALCTYSKRAKKMWFSGAKRPLLLIRDKDITMIKGNSYPIGSSYYQINRTYEEHSIDVQPNDKFYIFSDGITDQFGGASNKKFMYSRLKELLLEIESLPMDEQEKVIAQNIMSWKGDLEQTDDILILGVKI